VCRQRRIHQHVFFVALLDSSSGGSSGSGSSAEGKGEGEGGAIAAGRRVGGGLRRFEDEDAAATLRGVSKERGSE
jgi:hypothetical protein